MQFNIDRTILAMAYGAKTKKQRISMNKLRAKIRKGARTYGR